MKEIKKSVQELSEHLMKTMHGSGIDSDWRLMHSKDFVIIRNSYHCMDQNGYYDGWQDFSIQIPIAGDVTNYKLKFHGNSYLSQKYMLRDYLEQIFSSEIYDWLMKHDSTYRVITYHAPGNHNESLCLNPGLKIAELWRNGPTVEKYRITKFEIIYPK